MAASGKKKTPKKKKEMISRSRRLQLILISFFMTFCILQMILMIGRFAPYGTRTLATMDARIQYLDFFSYYKDVLEGKNTIGYTFTTSLGMNDIGIFSYYLSSPFSLLVRFFARTQMNSLLNLMVTLKLSMAAGTFSWYIQKRFRDRIPEWQGLLLALGYSLMQYNLAQCSNVMWLDGVYMLPLILLGVYSLVREGRILLLSVSVGLSILFNWYTGGMNCLCAGLWFLFEYFLWRIDRQEVTGRTWKQLRERAADRLAAGDRGGSTRLLLQPFLRFISAGLRFCLSMGIGVLLSAALFFPTVSVLRRGKGRAFYPEEYMLNRMRGNPLCFFRDFSVSSVSTSANVALFCGGLALFACLAFFTCRQYSVRKRVLGGVLLLVMLLSFYWQPLYYILSLFQNVDSYWYRHGYMGSMAILFLAAAYLAARPWNVESTDRAPETGLKMGGLHLRVAPVIAPLLTAVAASILTVAFWALEPTVSPVWIILSASLLLVMAVLWLLPVAAQGRSSRKLRRLCAALLFFLAFSELMCNTVLLVKRYSADAAEDYRSYSAQQQAQIAEIRARDTGFYRISQTRWRYYNKDGMTASFNDSMAYNYPSVASYTSTPENDTLWFLDRMGYQAENSRMNVVNTSIVSTDAFLGVKYILSDYPIKGLTRVPGLGTYNGKTVYENPYALPLAFVYDGEEMPHHEYSDPFTYQNELFTVVSGSHVTLYRPVEAVRQDAGQNAAYWRVACPEGNVVLYGNLVWDKFLNGTLTVNDSMSQGYARFLSPSVFYIPYSAEVDTYVKLETEEPLVLTDEQFYALDLDQLAAVTRQIREKKATDLVVENGRITCTAEAEEGQRLLVTIPRSAGWTVTVNGRRVATDRLAYCMMSIPLEEGHNEIELRHKIPKLREGILASILGLVLLTGFEVLRRLIERRERIRRLKARRAARERAARERERESTAEQTVETDVKTAEEPAEEPEQEPDPEPAGDSIEEPAADSDGDSAGGPDRENETAGGQQDNGEAVSGDTMEWPARRIRTAENRRE